VSVPRSCTTPVVEKFTYAFRQKRSDDEPAVFPTSERANARAAGARRAKAGRAGTRGSRPRLPPGFFPLAARTASCASPPFAKANARRAPQARAAQRQAAPAREGASRVCPRVSSHTIYRMHRVLPRLLRAHHSRQLFNALSCAHASVRGAHASVRARSIMFARSRPARPSSLRGTRARVLRTAAAHSACAASELLHFVIMPCGCDVLSCAGAHVRARSVMFARSRSARPSSLKRARASMCFAQLVSAWPVPLPRCCTL
jgi:hypothetical protein